MERGIEMDISRLINDYGRDYSPYMRNLVNHLPMGQLALYKLKEDVEYVESYSKDYIGKNKINPVKKDYPKIENLEDCLGNRDLYESALEIIKEQVNEENLFQYIGKFLNTYELGLSSGLFHSLIRLAYGLEGYQLDKGLIEEVERGLAYYLTAYRESKLFSKYLTREDFSSAMKELADSQHLKEVLYSKDSLGQRIKALYNDKVFMERAFLIEGSEEDKIRGLLDFLIPLYLNTRHIVVLHSITGLHALIVLKDFFQDYERAIDILTSSIITHLLAVENIEFGRDNLDHTELSWDCLISKAIESPDIHAIKLTYSSHELDKLYGMEKLKDCAYRRIKYK